MLLLVFDRGNEYLLQLATEGGTIVTVAGCAVLCPVFSLAASLAGTCAAQQPGDPPSAPDPTGIFTARKVFISNATGEIALAPGDPDLTYNEFYAAMKGWA